MSLMTNSGFTEDEENVGIASDALKGINVSDGKQRMVSPSGFCETYVEVTIPPSKTCPGGTVNTDIERSEKRSSTYLNKISSEGLNCGTGNYTNIPAQYITLHWASVPQKFYCTPSYSCPDTIDGFGYQMTDILDSCVTGCDGGCYSSCNGCYNKCDIWNNSCNGCTSCNNIYPNR